MAGGLEEPEDDCNRMAGHRFIIDAAQGPGVEVQ
eukprot:CAMPEP_0197945684 /NCGR_PEP_ID=MMETSP1439-20131203/126034_1 /TAXON_ID=66791 /ORGANISM="Gonyaulax spinifera, Strain CCMP409" /LENGTH=33 /DNA_ID= /DNA_START= /DNA_END= /DNA_ORIENTATION=